MFKSEVKGTGWEIAKIIIALIAFIYAIYLLIFAGKMMLFDNENVGPEITPANYDSIKNGEQVWGKIDNIISATSVGDLNYYLVKSDSGKILFFRTPLSSKCDRAMQGVLNGTTKDFYFKGYVKPMTKQVSIALSMGMLADNTLKNNNIRSSFDDVTIKYVIDTSLYDTYVDKNKVIIATIAGVLFLFFVVFKCLKKIVTDVIYSIGVKTGRIKPLKPEIEYNPRDVELTFYSDYDKDRDALSQGYNLRKSEFAPERINSRHTEEIEYYSGYDKDAIDFTLEKKKETIYGEEYKPPTLEKNIDIYEGYEYDSLDFAHEPVEKKDINGF